MKAEEQRKEAMVFEQPRDTIADMWWFDVLRSLPDAVRAKLSVHAWRESSRVMRKTIVRQARREALEEAAREVQWRRDDTELANAIRALMEKEE